MIEKIGNDWIYSAYKDKVQHYIKSRVANVHDAEDLLATVFLKIYQNINSFDEEKSYSHDEKSKYTIIFWEDVFMEITKELIAKAKKYRRLRN